MNKKPTRSQLENMAAVAKIQELKGGRDGIQPAPFKGVECILCGWTGRVLKALPIRMAECKHCQRSSGLRRFKPEDTPNG